MPKASKFSPDEGLTIYDLKDNDAVHYGDQSKGYVGKNLFINTGKTETISSVAFTHNSDDSVGLNNTASAMAIYNVGSVKELSEINQDVILSGCPSGGSTSTYSLQIRTLNSANVIQNGTYLIDNGNGVKFNPSGSLVDTNGNSVSISDLYLNIRIGSGEVTTGKTFYPMIRLASIPDSTYEPYLTPNTEIDNKVSYADNAILGAKNLLAYPYIGVTKTEGGITFTNNGDGSITLNGTSDSGYPAFDLMSASDLVTLISKYGSLRLTGAINGSNIRLYAHGSKYFIDDGNGVVIPSTETSFSEPLRVQVLPNKTIDNVTIRPMLRLESDTDDTYVPYAMTNKELTDKDSKSVHYGEQAKGYVGKNLIPLPYAESTSFEKNGIEYWINDDGTVKINGTASADGGMTLFDSRGKNIEFAKGNVILSKGSASPNFTLYINEYNNGTFKRQISLNGISEITFNNNYSDYNEIFIGIYVYSGKSPSNEVCYPMLRWASISDGTYETYGKPNTEIINNISDSVNSMLGASNFISYPYNNTSKTDTGVQFTINNDGSITLSTDSNGATANVLYGLNPWEYQKFPEGKYILSDKNGYLDSNNHGAYTLLSRKKEASGNVNYGVDTTKNLGSVCAFDVNYSQYDYFQVNLFVKAGTVITTPLTLYPMIKIASDTDDTFSLYSMTNRALTNKIMAIKSAAANASDFAAFKSAMANI